MNQTLVFQKLVKYFWLWHNLILYVPARGTEKVLPGKSASKNKLFQN